MDKTIYSKIIEILYQFMDLEVSNNLIWGNSKEFSIKVFKECGYEVTDWSWYDGHLVSLKCTEYPPLTVNYAACASTYCIVNSNPETSIIIQVKEVDKLRTKRNLSEPDKIEVKQHIGNNEHRSVSCTLSVEFDNFVKELQKWKISFDKSEDFDYSITIYLGKEVDLGQV